MSHRTVRSAIPAVMAFTLLVTSAMAFSPGLGDPATRKVPVSGRVTLDGRDWPGTGLVMFQPVDTKSRHNAFPGVSMIGPEGEFQVTSQDPGDGLEPGIYRVTVWCRFAVSGEAATVPGLIPDRYADPGTSGLTLTVVPDAAFHEVVLDVKGR